MSLESAARHAELMGELFGGEAAPMEEPEVTPKPVAPAAFCWACGTTHTDEDTCIPRSE